MKNFINFVTIIATVFAVSCQRDSIVEQHDISNDNEAQELSYAISEEEALARLDEFMTAFDGTETRAQRRAVKSITKVSSADVCDKTRASSEEDIENLFYIVEFENGEGSAVLGADRRLEPVYAVFDETVITTEDFRNAANGENSNDISTFTAEVISQSAQNSRLVIDFPGFIDPPSSDWMDDIYQTSVTRYIEPMLNTKWNQTGYFNDKFRDKPKDADYNDDQQCAGCTTIALGQILNYHTYPSPIDLNGHTYYWRDINSATWNNTSLDDQTKDVVAAFLFDLAEALDAIYYENGETGAGRSDVKRVLKNSHYYDITNGEINEARIYPMLYNYKPVWTEGYSSNGNGHAWVIDGWKTISTTHIRITYNGNNVEISRQIIGTTSTHYVHCNMGWLGECDGYYTMNIFDVSVQLPDDRIETEYGDWAGTNGDSVYTYGFNAVTYNF